MKFQEENIPCLLTQTYYLLYSVRKVSSLIAVLHRPVSTQIVSTQCDELKTKTE